MVSEKNKNRSIVMSFLKNSGVTQQGWLISFRERLMKVNNKE